jgi:23S rRNA (cytosine1962-C5)-methyltransferase
VASDSPPLFLRKDEERRLLAGHAWIYANEVDTARSPLKSFEPGQAVEVISQRGQWLAHAYVNPHSLIAARVTGRQREQILDETGLRHRLQAALELRERLVPGGCYRWVYGESDALPGLVVDRYGEVAVVQLNTAGMERLRDTVVQGLADTPGIRAVQLRCDAEPRALEGLPQYVETAHGELPDIVEILEHGVPFLVPLDCGQKTGWFYDQADNRLRGRALLGEGTVIDAFCYAGGWGVNAALAGADRVLFIDSSQPALEIAQRNAERNGVLDRCSFICADAAEALRELVRGERARAVVVDPPAFAKRKKDIQAGSRAYQRLNELALALMPGDGFLVSCSCSQHVDRDSFLRLVQRAAVRQRRELKLLFEGGQSTDHPVHPAMPETRYLKALFLHVPGQGNFASP